MITEIGILSQQEIKCGNQECRIVMPGNTIRVSQVNDVCHVSIELLLVPPFDK